MSKTELFFMLLMTGLMVVNAVREFNNFNYAMSATLVMIPVFGWVSILVGK
jgi:hypothetical protein